MGGSGSFRAAFPVSSYCCSPVLVLLLLSPISLISLARSFRYLTCFASSFMPNNVKMEGWLPKSRNDGCHGLWSSDLRATVRVSARLGAG